MKIYRYWQTESATLHAGDKPVPVRCHGGSNTSPEDARRRALEKIDAIRRKLAGDTTALDDYEAEIREEIVQVINDSAIITRNRYGAEVLNTADVMIMDIDQPPFTWRDWFRRKTRALGKQRIVERVRALAQSPTYAALGFRIYETRNGIRVIVLGKAFDARSPAALAMMQAFACDPLYVLLCQKQGCFRARLTPKPHRMRLRAHRVKYPRTTDEQAAFQQWLAGYNERRQRYTTCRLLEQVGPTQASEVVRVHDAISGVGQPGTLA